MYLQLWELEQVLTHLISYLLKAPNIQGAKALQVRQLIKAVCMQTAAACQAQALQL